MTAAKLDRFQQMAAADRPFVVRSKADRRARAGGGEGATLHAGVRGLPAQAGWRGETRTVAGGTTAGGR
ncbi:hypothetical protein J0H58_33970 [bacterium]|nr:hypothetical protein [bacterium]